MIHIKKCTKINIHFPDYNGKELMDIFMTFMNKHQFTISSDAYDLLSENISDEDLNKFTSEDIEVYING